MKNRMCFFFIVFTTIELKFTYKTYLNNKSIKLRLKWLQSKKSNSQIFFSIQLNKQCKRDRTRILILSTLNESSGVSLLHHLVPTLSLSLPSRDTNNAYYYMHRSKSDE